MKRRLCQLFVLVAFIIATGFAATTSNVCTFKGRVVDKNDLSSLSDVNVICDSIAGCVTNFWGNFELKVMKQGLVTISFSYIGYKTQLRSATSQHGITVTFNELIKMEED